jgi:twin arginine-targeting protein translocase, TatA/E family
MFSVPHLVIIFIVVLVVFGPHKLPELARSLGKLMAEFRKASTDFKMAFEEEMRAIERQAREAEWKKSQEAAASTTEGSATLAASGDAPRILPETVEPVDPVITPVSEAVARESHSTELLSAADEPPVTEGTPPSEPSDAEPGTIEPGKLPSHDQRQPA